MKTMTAEEASVELDKLLDEVCATGGPLGIRRNGSVYVLTTLADYEKDDETAYLTRSEANRKALDRSIEQSRQGQVVIPDPALFA
ncbi:MAG: type II toxin-antitoxin system Phd/YefM family antitoxin [Dehalococcoidia bacterium]